jgi:intracellular sulfur oxidation DsrE/DsrF family protein
MIHRSAFLGTSLAAVAAAVSAGEADAAIGLVEKSGEFDVAAFSKIVARGADVRHVWDAGKLYPQILGGVKNSLNGLQFGFGIAATRIATAFVTHNESNLLLYADSAWAAYRLGELFSVHDPSGAVVASNIFAPAHSASMLADPNDPRGFYQDASIATLQKRGVTFFVCNTALVQHASQIVNGGAAKGQSIDDVVRTLRRSLLPHVMLVPSGVATVAYLQSRYQYAYLTEQ